MSMSVMDYDNWCDAMANTNQVISEVESHRKENLKWFCEELKEIFSVCGEIESVRTARDGTVIDVIFTGDSFKLNTEVFSKVYCPMRVLFDESLHIRLYPNIKGLEDTIH